jgi:outer membrane protein assembly factor BamE (lipoprotein component of BamABCDE complex)
MAACGADRCGALAAACWRAAARSSTTGYMIDEVLVQSVQPGVDNRQSVERTLGRPSFTSQFGQPVWYYVSST